MARGAGCLNWASPDLWGAGVGNRPGLPDRGGLGLAYLLPALSSAGASIASTMLRFHSPLIEPDGRISRIRLSDKDSCLRPREAPRPATQADQAQLLVQVLVGEP